MKDEDQVIGASAKGKHKKLKDRNLKGFGEYSQDENHVKIFLGLPGS